VELTAGSTRARTIRGPRLAPDLRALGAWALGAALVIYLGLRGGGYDPLVHGEVGVAVWWIVLLGAAVGVLPVVRLHRSAWIAIGLFGAFVLWTGLGLTWTSSSERTADELARVSMYGGILVVACCVLSRRTARHGLNGVAFGIAFVGCLSVASRIWPGSFPSNDVSAFLGTQGKALNYPINYSDGLGSFLAIGVPVLLGVGATARTIAGRALAVGAIPILLLGMFLAQSRGGVFGLVLGVAAFYLLAHDRLPKLASGLVALAGSAILVAAVSHRHAVRDGLTGPAAHHQAHQLLGLIVLTCLGVAFVQAAIALLDRHAERPAWMVVPRRRALIGSLVAVAAVVAVAVAAGAPGTLQNKWNQFTQPNYTGAPTATLFDRLSNLSGSRRYQYWTAAGHAFHSQPLHGIGPGTFEFYWLQHGHPYEFVRNAHSLYLETLAELGIVGLLLLVAALGYLVVGPARAALAARGDPLLRVVAAASAAGVVTFLGGAAFNWTWQIAAMPVTALVLAASGLASGRPAPLRLERAEAAASPPTRGLMVALSLGAFVAIAIPLAATTALRDSQADARAADLPAALKRTNTAVDLQPYAATPRLQRGLVLEEAHDYAAAESALKAAAAREPSNWRIWLVLSRVHAEAGHPAAAVAAYRRARSLNPGSPIFAR
jgi:hypothetical protein